MESLLFLFAYPLNNNEVSLLFKFKSQIKAAQNIGYDVWFTAYHDDNIFLCNKNDKYFLGKSLKFNQNIIQCHFIYKYINKILRIKKFDYAYIRNLPPIPVYISGLKELKSNNCKIIVEIPTYRNNPQKIENYNKLLYRFTIPLLEYLFRRSMANSVDLFTLIGDHSETYLDVKAININNGLDIESIPLIKKVKKNDNEIHLIAIANISYWHGYDRIIEGLNNYYLHFSPSSSSHQKKVFFHLFGTSGDRTIDDLRKKVELYKLSEFVFFEGYKTGIDLDCIFNKADMAVGSLATHRIKIDNATPLKIIEYSARGIPFVYSGENELLKNFSTYSLKVPSDDSPVDINKIIEFYNDLEQITDLQIKIRDYAKKNMGWEKELIRVIKLLNRESKK